MRAGIGTLAAALMMGTPALADVKAGADAWARGDYTAAIEQWRGPAIAGDADAQFNLGQAYKLGRGVPVDLAQAEAWYAKAAARGHPLASDDYGLLLNQEGKRAQALPWLEKSAARDERRAELILGTMVFNGDGVPKDEVRGYALISRSSQQGLDQASTTLAQMDGFLTPEQRAKGAAIASDLEARGKLARTTALASVTPRQGRRALAADAAMDGPAPAPKVADRPKPATSARPAAKAAVVPAPAPQSQGAHETPRAVPSSAAHVTNGGHWRVQLGAFHEPGAAQALWAKVGARVGGHPSYAKSGAVTRLQAGPFASKADAQHACHAAGVSCVVVPG